MPIQENEIQSTEKLLKLIRTQDPGPAAKESASPSMIENPPKPNRRSFLSSISFQKRITIGVDIGHTHIKLAKISRSDKSYELLDYKDIPFKSSISIADERIAETLQSALDQFCADSKAYDIWGAIQSANVETHCIRIPKLPRKQIDNAIFWTFTRKSPFDKHTEILDYEILGDVNEGGLKKTQVLVFKAPKEDINTFKAVFQKIGYPLKGISIAPFAIQNLFRTRIIDYPEEDSCCLFIGRDWSRIAIYSQGNLVLSRGIKAGMRSMIEAISLALQREEDLSKTPQQEGSDETGANGDFEKSSMTLYPKAQKIFFDFVGTQPSAAAIKPSDATRIDRTQVFQMVIPAMERLIRQVERTFEHYTLNFNTEGVKRIFISGQIIANPAVVEHLAKQLDLPVIPMNPFPAESPFTRQIRIPESAWDRESYVPAIGLALSSNAITPNFLFTHENKNQFECIRRNNMRLLTGCMLILMVMIGIFSWQQRELGDRRLQLNKLEAQMLTYNPPVEKDLLLGLYAKTKQRRHLVAEIARRYTPAAMITEISQITPPNIRLLYIDALFDQKKSGKTKETQRDVTIEGIVFGDTGTFETSLASYLLSLKNSPMFQKPSVQNKQIEYYNDQQVLHFTTKLLLDEPV